MTSQTQRQIQCLLRETDSSCIYCGRPLSVETATRDHIRPYCLGGVDAMENLVASCKSCNVKKDSQTLSSFIASNGRKYKKTFRKRVKDLMEADKMPEFKGRLLLEADKKCKRKHSDVRVSPYTLRRVALETNGLCIYCGKPIEKSAMCVDLILDPSLGGKVNRDNMVLCCESCREKKLKLGSSGFRSAMEGNGQKAFRHRVHQLAFDGHISARKAQALLPHSRDLADLRRCWKFKFGRLHITFRWDKSRENKW